MTTVKRSFCRLCAAYCPIEVTVDGGRAIAVRGNKRAPLYGGYTCPKGRALPALHANPRRLTHSLKRLPDGSRVPISSALAMKEIAAKLSSIIERHGPRSVALYIGNAVTLYPTTPMVAGALMGAIGSPMSFTAGTLDQPGIQIAGALHGIWLGGRTAIENADVALIVGGNPLISKQHFAQNPGRRITDSIAGGTKLIVIDPRRTETAARAHVHIQGRPGEDATILAGLLHLIFAANAVDDAFVDLNTEGIYLLREAVAPFTPAYVADRAGIDRNVLDEAALLLCNARTAAFASGTGSTMSMHGTLNCYLQLCIQSVRGFWAREGERFTRSRVTLPRFVPKAQPRGPFQAWGFDPQIRIRGLRNSVAGLPTGALAEEILTPGDGQIRALFCTGNPVKAFPDSALTQRALENLELLVTPTVELTDTAVLAHYVIATKMTLETPATTQFQEAVGIAHPGYGWEVPYAAYTPALLSPPAGADVIEDWQLFYRVAQEMGLQLSISAAIDATNASASQGDDIILDMAMEPSSEDLLAALLDRAVVKLAEIRKHPDGRVFGEAQEHVVPRDPDCSDRLQLADDTMIDELGDIIREDYSGLRRSQEVIFPLLLVPSRLNRTFNSMYRDVPGLASQPANPVRLHPSDLVRLKIFAGDVVEIRSPHGAVQAIAAEDDRLLPGVISLSHGFGPSPYEHAPASAGANVNRLLRIDDEFDRITGMPRMSAVPVAVCKVEHAETAA